MDVREATPGDAAAVADLFDLSERAAERVLQERSVVVADSGECVVGACAFDSWGDAVQVTRFERVDDTVSLDALLAPAFERANDADLPVEILVLDGEDVRAIRDSGFESVGAGPRFEGRETTRYRRES